MFPLHKSAAGSLQNCPECGLATQVGGENDRLWTAIKGAAVLGLVLAGALAYQIAGPTTGAAVFLVGAAILGLVRAGL